MYLRRTCWTSSTGCVARRPGATQHPPDAEAELCLTCSHVGIVGVFVRGPKTVAKSGCAAARGQEGCWGVRIQASSVMGTWMIPPRQILREGSAPVEHKGGKVGHDS